MIARYHSRFTIETLQAGRALAALMVVVHHAAMATRDFVAPLPAWIATPAAFGWIGVDFFFVLSGFIIYYSAATRPLERNVAWKFYRGRLIRIYAPYLPIVTVLVLAYLALPQLSGADRRWSLLTSFTLLPLRYPPALSVAWTLQHEMLFYTIFALSFYRGALFPVLALWSGAIILVGEIGLATVDPLEILFSPLNFEFMFGVATAMLFTRTGQLPSWEYVTIVPIAIAAWWFSGHDHGWAALFLGLSIAATIMLVVRAEVAGKISVSSRVTFLGAASYSIYLVHDPVLSLTQRLLSHIPILREPRIALFCGVGVAIGFGVLYYLLIEKRLTRRLARRLG